MDGHWLPWQRLAAGFLMATAVGCPVVAQFSGAGLGYGNASGSPALQNAASLSPSPCAPRQFRFVADSLASRPSLLADWQAARRRFFYHSPWALQGDTAVKSDRPFPSGRLGQEGFPRRTGWGGREDYPFDFVLDLLRHLFF